MTPSLFEQHTIRSFERFLDGAQKRHQRAVDLMAWQTRQLVNIEGRYVKTAVKWRRFRDEARQELPLFPPKDEKPEDLEEQVKRAPKTEGVAVDSGVLAHMEKMAKRGMVRKKGPKKDVPLEINGRVIRPDDDDGPKTWLTKD